MKFLKDLDGYKALILLCLIAAPACGYWCYSQQQTIDACRKALQDAPRLLQDIGALQKKVEMVVQNRHSTTDATQQPGVYFQGQILAAASQNLNTNDFQLNAPKSETATLAGKGKATDYVAEVVWQRKDLSLPLAFVYAVLFNCESGARPGGEAAGVQSIWKLRSLEIQNSTNEKLMSLSEAPPPELEDRWTIRKMWFARREPVASSR